MRIIPENSYKRDAVDTEIDEDLCSWCDPGQFQVLARIKWGTSSHLGTPDFHSRPNIVTGIVSKGNTVRSFASTSNIVSVSGSDVKKSNDFVSGPAINTAIADVTVQAQNLFISGATIQIAISGTINARREFASGADIVSGIGSVNIHKSNLFNSSPTIAWNIVSDQVKGYVFAVAPAINFSVTGDIIFGGRFVSTANIVSNISDPAFEYMVPTGASPVIQTSIISVGHAERIFASQADIQTGYLSSVLEIGWFFATQADIVSDITDPAIEISFHFESSPSIGTDISSDANTQREFGSSASIVSGAVSDIDIQIDIEFVSSPSIVTGVTSDIEKGGDAGFESGNEPIILTIDSSQIDEDLTDFPVMLNLSAASGITDTDLTLLFDDLAWTGDDFSNLDNWEKYGQASNVFVSNNVLTVQVTSGDVDNEVQGVYSKFRLDQSQDYEIQVDFTMTGATANAWYADMLVNFKDQTGEPYDGAWDTLVFSRRSYNSSNGGHVWQSLAAEDGSFKTTDTDVDSNMSGKLKQVKIGNDISCYYDSGSGWVLQQTYSFTDFDNKNGHVNFMLSMQNSQNVTMELSNFTIAVGNVIWAQGTNPNRKKIAVKLDDQTTELNVEIAGWDSINRTIELHTMVPSVLAAADTTLYFYYDSTQDDNILVGDTGEAAAQAVWDSNFKSVYHLNQDPSGGADAIKDSTSNNNHLTSTGSMTTGDLVDSWPGKGIDFDGSNDQLNRNNSIITDYPFTMEVAAPAKSIDSANSPACSLADNSLGSDLFVLHIFNGNAREMHSNAFSNSGSVDLIVDEFYHLATVHSNATSHDIFTNGADKTSDTNSYPFPSGLDRTTIGSVQDDSPGYWLGENSEVRYSSIDRSDAWIKATYHTLHDTLITYSGALDYTNKIDLTIDKSNVDEDLTDFPVMINLSASAIGNGDITEVFDELAYQFTGDDFNGTNGDPLKTDLWADNLYEIQNNRAEITITTSKSFKSNFRLRGDFNIDIEFVDFTSIHHAQQVLYLYTEDEQNGVLIKRDFEDPSYDYFYGLEKVDNIWDWDNHAWALASTSYGILRAVRSGSTITLWSKNGPSSWVSTWSGTVNAEDLKVVLFGAGVAAGITYKFENFNINSGTVVWPANTNPNRKKIAVTTADGITECPVEIDIWDDTNKKAALWVKVPSVLAAQNTKLKLYFDSAHADNPLVGDTGETAAQAVWDAYFEAVYHMSQDPSGGAGAILDSTDNIKHGTSQGSMTTSDLIDGLKSGKSIQFDGSNDAINIGEWPAMPLLTVEMLGKHGIDEQCLQISKYKNDSALDSDWLIVGNDSQKWNFVTWQGGYEETTSVNSFSLGSYFYGVASFATDDKKRNYLNGDIEDTSADIGADVDSHSQPIFLAGRAMDTSPAFTPGTFGEVRFSSIDRSGAWIKATYHALFDTLITYETESYVFVNEISMVIDSSQVDEDLADFPVMINLRADSGITNGNTTEVFQALAWTGDDLLSLDTNVWDVLGQPENVTINNGLQCYMDSGDVLSEMQGVISKFQLDSTQDFDVAVDFDITAPNTNQWYVEMCASFQDTTRPPNDSWDSATLTRKRYSVNQFFEGRSVEDGSWTSADVDNNTNTTGKFRIKKVGNDMSMYYDIGGGWVFQKTDTFTDFDGKDARISLTVRNTVDQPTITAIYTNFVINSGTVIWPNGDPARKKIAVTTADGSHCKVEIENWDATNERISLWAKIPSILADADTTLYFKYDPSIIDNIHVGDTGEAAAQAVWDSDFVGVWHLAQAPLGADSILDSTGNNHNMSPTNMDGTNLVEGLIGKAIEFNGTDEYLETSDSVDWDFNSNDFTLEFLCDPDDLSIRRSFLSQHADDQNVWYFGHHMDPLFVLASRSGGATQLSGTTTGISVGDFNYVGIKRTTNDFQFWLNASARGSSFSDSDSMADISAPFAIGKPATASPYNNFDGKIAEVRVTKGLARSDAWLKATYHALYDTLITYDVLMPDDDFSGASMDTDRWTVIGQGANVTQDGLGYLEVTVGGGDVSGERQGVLSNFEIESSIDWQCQVDFEVTVGPSTDGWYIGMVASFQDQTGQPNDPAYDTQIITQRRYSSVHEFQSLAVQDTGWKTTYSDTDSTLTGKLRLYHEAGWLRSAYNIGGGWVEDSYDFSGDFDGLDARITLYLMNAASQPTATVRWSNFLLNFFGTYYWWK